MRSAKSLKVSFLVSMSFKQKVLTRARFLPKDHLSNVVKLGAYILMGKTAGRSGVSIYRNESSSDVGLCSRGTVALG